MVYVCAACHVIRPCSVAEHYENHTLIVWQPDSADVSIPCWVMDHADCQVALFCSCTCHKQHLDAEPSVTPSPQSLAEQ